ncbi:MAG: hypothetical protein JXR03_04900 [Cyclobacteriaceae bacterium]
MEARTNSLISFKSLQSALLIFVLLLAMPHLSSAQGPGDPGDLIGDRVIAVGTLKNYRIDASQVNSSTWSVGTGNAQIINMPNYYEVDIEASQAGNVVITVDYDDGYGIQFDYAFIEAINATPPPPPSTPTTLTTGCESWVITRSGAPPTNVVWYWQGQVNDGTSTSLGSGANYTVTEAGTYYIRSYDTSTSLWGNDRSYTINQIPTTPAAPTAMNKSRCGVGTVQLEASGTSGGTFNWYSSTGTYLATGATFVTPSLSSNTTYEVKNDNSYCEGPGKVVQVTVTIPNLTTTNGTNSCQVDDQVTISAKTINNPQGTVTHRWFLSNSPGAAEITDFTTVDNPGDYTTYKTVGVNDPNRSFWVAAYVDGCETSREQVTASFDDYSEPTLVVTNVEGDFAKCEGEPFHLAVAGGGAGSTYEWRQDSPSGQVVSTAAAFYPSLNYTDTNNGTKTYYVGGVLTYGGGCSTTITPSESISVTVYRLTPGSIDGAQSICPTTSASLVSTASAIGGDESGITYKWQVSANGTSGWQDAPGANTGLNYTTGDLAATSHFRRRATSCSLEEFTNVEKITVTTSIQLTTPSASNKSRCAPGTVTFTASGSETGSEYEWYTEGGTYITTANSYTTPSLSEYITTYKVRADLGGCKSPFKTVTATISNANITTTNGTNSCQVDDQATISAKTINNPQGTVTHRWFLSNSPGAAEITDFTTVDNPGDYTTYKTVGVNDPNRSFWVAAYVDGCETSREQVTAIFDDYSEPTLVVTNVEGDVAKCEGEPFHLAVAGGGTGSTYEWRQDSPSGQVVSTASAFYPSLNYTDTNNGTKTYYVVGVLTYGGSCSTTITSDPISVTVYRLLPGSISSGDSNICPTTSASLNGTSAIGGDENGIDYRWQISTNGTSGWQDAPGANTGVNYTTQSLTATRYFRRRATSCSLEEYTNALMINVTIDNLNAGQVSINGASSPLTICPDESVSLVSDQSASCGTTSSSQLLYQWQVSANGTSGWSAAGGTNNQESYSISNLPAGSYFFRRRVGYNPAYGLGYKYTSQSLQVIVEEELVPGSISISSQLVCPEESVTITGTLPSCVHSTTTINYSWYVSENCNDCWVLVSGATEKDYTVPTNNVGVFKYQRRIDLGSGAYDYTNEVGLEVRSENMLNDPLVSEPYLEICGEGVVDLHILNPEYTSYTWYPPSGGSIVGGSTLANVAITNEMTQYRVKAVDGTCESGLVDFDILVRYTHLLVEPEYQNTCENTDEVTLIADSYSSEGVRASQGAVHNWYTGENNPDPIPMFELSCANDPSCDANNPPSYYAVKVPTDGDGIRTQVRVTKNVGIQGFWVELLNNGCSTPRMYTEAVFIEATTPILNATSIDLDYAKCEGEVFNLFASGGAEGSTYAWYDQDTGDQLSSPSTDGSLQLQLTYVQTNSGSKNLKVVGDLMDAQGCNTGTSEYFMTIYVEQLNPGIIELADDADDDGSIIICPNTDFLINNLQSADCGGSEGLSYYWQFSETAMDGSWLGAESFVSGGNVNLETFSGKVLDGGDFYFRREVQSLTGVAWTDYVHVSVLCEPSVPYAASNLKYCGTDPITLSASAGQYGDEIRWYDDASSDQILSTDDNYVITDFSIFDQENPKTFYVSTLNADILCESDRIPFTVEFFAEPNAPMISSNPVVVSTNGIASLSVTSGGPEYRWFASSSSQDPLFTGANVNSYFSESSIVYVESFDPNVSGCSSERVPVEVFVPPYTSVAETRYVTQSAKQISGEEGVILKLRIPTNSLTWRSEEGMIVGHEEELEVHHPGTYTASYEVNGVTVSEEVYVGANRTLWAVKDGNWPQKDIWSYEEGGEVIPTHPVDGDMVYIKDAVVWVYDDQSCDGVVILGSGDDSRLIIRDEGDLTIRGNAVIVKGDEEIVSETKNLEVFENGSITCIGN